MMKVYLDNMIVSGKVRADIKPPEEMTAMWGLLDCERRGLIHIVTSRESWREQERTRDPQVREELRNAQDRTDVVSHDHSVLGFNMVDYGYYGFIASPSSLTRLIRRCLTT